MNRNADSFSWWYPTTITDALLPKPFKARWRKTYPDPRLSLLTTVRWQFDWEIIKAVWRGWNWLVSKIKASARRKGIGVKKFEAAVYRLSRYRRRLAADQNRTTAKFTDGVELASAGTREFDNRNGETIGIHFVGQAWMNILLHEQSINVWQLDCRAAICFLKNSADLTNESHPAEIGVSLSYGFNDEVLYVSKVLVNYRNPRRQLIHADGRAMMLKKKYLPTLRRIAFSVKMLRNLHTVLAGDLLSSTQLLSFHQAFVQRLQANPRRYLHLVFLFVPSSLTSSQTEEALNS